LERNRTINSISLAEERQILKEIAAVKRGMVQVEEYNTLEKQVQEVKVGKTNDLSTAMMAPQNPHPRDRGEICRGTTCNFLMVQGAKIDGSIFSSLLSR
jgi:hypothetical protein